MGTIAGSGEIEAMDNPEKHASFIRSQWPEFAAFAWMKYQKEGRGAVVIDLRNASSSGNRLNVPVFYVAEASPRLEERGGWPDQEVAGVIRDYDPSQDVVFIFLRLDGDLFYYNVSDDLTPPEAYRLKQAPN